MALLSASHTGKQRTEEEHYTTAATAAYIAADVVVSAAFALADDGVQSAASLDATSKADAAVVSAALDVDAHLVGPPTDGALTVAEFNNLDLMCNKVTIFSQRKDLLTTPAAAWDLSADVPDGAVILSVQLNLQDVITAAGGATKVGIGVVADPDKYGKTSGVTANLVVNTVPDWAVLSGAADIQLYAVDNNGDAAGTIGGGLVGTDEISVKIVYILPLAAIPNS